MPLQIAAPPPNLSPNQINRVRCIALPRDMVPAIGGVAYYIVPLFAFHAASGRGVLFELVVANGKCSVLRKNPSATVLSDFNDILVILGDVEVADGYTRTDARVNGPGSKAARCDLVVAELLAMGCIHPELTGAVV